MCDAVVKNRHGYGRRTDCFSFQSTASGYLMSYQLRRQQHASLAGSAGSRAFTAHAVILISRSTSRISSRSSSVMVREPAAVSRSETTVSRPLTNASISRLCCCTRSRVATLSADTAFCFSFKDCDCCDREGARCERYSCVAGSVCGLSSN